MKKAESLPTKYTTGQEVARQTITAMCTELGITSHLIVASMRDHASVNEVAMRTVSVLYNKMIGCFCHTSVNTPVLDDFPGCGLGFHVVQKHGSLGEHKLAYLLHHSRPSDGGGGLKSFTKCMMILEMY